MSVSWLILLRNGIVVEVVVVDVDVVVVGARVVEVDVVVVGGRVVEVVLEDEAGVELLVLVSMPV